MEVHRRDILHASKFVKWLGIFIMYLITVYWSTESVLKYHDEPADTSIQYTHGDNKEGIQFPLITLCPLEPDHVGPLIETCQLKINAKCPLPDLIGNGQCDVFNLNQYCNYDGGDCCDLFYFDDFGLDGKCHDELNTPLCNFDNGACCGFWIYKQDCQICECHELTHIYPNIHQYERDYKGETFQQLLKECIEEDNKLNLTKLMNDLAYSRSNYIKGILFEKNVGDNFRPIELQDHVWTSYFNPYLGYCHTMNLMRIEKYKNLPMEKEYQIFIQTKDKTFKMIIHEENEMPDSSYEYILGKEPALLTGTKSVKLIKRKLARTNLERLPCADETYTNCKENLFHSTLRIKHKCRPPQIFNAPGFFDDRRLPVCTNNVTYEVIILNRRLSLNLY